MTEAPGALKDMAMQQWTSRGWTMVERSILNIKAHVDLNVKFKLMDDVIKIMVVILVYEGLSR